MEFKNLPHGSKFTSIQIGGSFSILLDTHGKALVWGANTNGEMGLGDT
jgi:alpha-tubulin suppressor-like RCC1 family protein